jgi:2-polyprenyl-6-methoxyphenol hydroxylase-like FAD-dependent oxidoreductase
MEETMLPTDTDVLIVGAGPTGLALAATLQQAGIRHVLLDKLAEGQNTSRAAVIHAHTLEVLDSIGVADHLADRGLKLSTFSIRDRDRPLLSLPFDELASKYSYLLMLPQDVTERILAERLIALGGMIHRGFTATKVDQCDGIVKVLVKSQTGECVIRARYVVGADGMHSMIRAAADIEFEGAPYPESFVLADVRMDWPLRDKKEVSLFFSTAGLAVVAPLPDGSYRVVATLEDAPERPEVKDIQALIDARGPGAQRAKVNDLIWSSRFRLHHRLASSYRNNRLFLVGDAAHVHSPAGGQGMNCGLVDACVLGQLLSDVIRGKRPEAALNLYEDLRRPAAAQVLALAGRLTGLATVRSRFKRAVRNAVFSVVNRMKPAKQRMMLNLSGLGRKDRAQLPQLGSVGQARGNSPHWTLRGLIATKML